MFGRDGRVWLAATVRAAENPAFCKAGSDHPSAKAFPMERAARHIAVLDPKTKKYTFVDTCYSTHHPQFGYDANDTLWTSGGGPVVGWLNTKMFDQTGDAAKSQGWTALVLDSNGNGKRDAYAEPDQPADPTKDMRINSPFYAVMPSPVDGSIWGSTLGVPGAVVRLAPGSNPPETALAEIYRVPMPGFGARGADIDSKGVVWVSLGSGHMGSFDRRKCKAPLNGPKATGDHCPEGWSVPSVSGSGLQGHRREQRRVELLLVGRSAQHVRAWQRRADVHRQSERRHHRLRERPDGRPARAVSDRLLRQGLRRPHRRSEGGMERPRAVGRQRRPHAVADRGWQRHEAARGALPAASGSAGEVKITVYQKPTCTTCRQVHAALVESGVDFDAVNYYVDPIPKKKLLDLLRKMHMTPRELLRTKEPVYKTLRLAERELADDEIVDLMVKNPDLIQRPIVEKGGRAVLARPAERLKEII